MRFSILYSITVVGFCRKRNVEREREGGGTFEMHKQKANSSLQSNEMVGGGGGEMDESPPLLLARSEAFR